MTHRERILRNVFLTMLAAFPIAVITMPTVRLQGSVMPEQPVLEVVRDRARSYRATLMQEARMNSQLRDKCAEQVTKDPAFRCPDYHDRAAVRAFLLHPDADVVAHAAADDDASMQLTVDSLDEKEQMLLRRYLNAHSCPSTLQQYNVEGFYELCLTMLYQTTSRDERMGVTEKVQERFKTVHDSVEERRARRMRAR